MTRGRIGWIVSSPTDGSGSLCVELAEQDATVERIREAIGGEWELVERLVVERDPDLPRDRCVVAVEPWPWGEM